SLPAYSSFAFPPDPYVADGLSVTGAQVYSGAIRRLTIWGGTILSISKPVHSGSASGNSAADVLVRFHTNGSAVLLAWGGHIAQSSYWNRAAGGPADGAGEVSGAPWHMRTLQLDGAGNKNQDRSIQPSAIVGSVPPGGLAPPTPTPPPPLGPGTGAPIPRPRPHATAPATASGLPDGDRSSIVAAIGVDLPASGIGADETIDAFRKYVIPGGIDFHTHMELPFGGTFANDTFETGTRAAAFGGTTSIVDFAVQSRGKSLRDGLDAWHA